VTRNSRATARCIAPSGPPGAAGRHHRHLKSNAGRRGEALAEALPDLQAGVLEMALDELTVLKDPASLATWQHS